MRRLEAIGLAALALLGVAPGAAAAGRVVLAQGPAVGFPTRAGVRLVGAPTRIGFPDVSAALVDRATGTRVLARLDAETTYLDAVADGRGGAWLVGAVPADGEHRRLVLVRVDHAGRERARRRLAATDYAVPVALGDGAVAIEVRRAGRLVVDGIDAQGRLRSSRPVEEGVGIVGGGDGVLAVRAGPTTTLRSAATWRQVARQVAIPPGVVGAVVTPEEVVVATRSEVRRLGRWDGLLRERHVVRAGPLDAPPLDGVARAGDALWLAGAFVRVDRAARSSLAGFAGGRLIRIAADRATGVDLLGYGAEAPSADARGVLAVLPNVEHGALAMSRAGRVRFWAPWTTSGPAAIVALGDRALVLTDGPAALVTAPVGAVADIGPGRRIASQALPAPIEDAVPAGGGRYWIALRRPGPRVVVALVGRRGRMLRRLPPLAGVLYALAADGDRVAVAYLPPATEDARLARLDAGEAPDRWRSTALCWTGLCQPFHIALGRDEIAVAEGVGGVSVWRWSDLRRTSLRTLAGVDAALVAHDHGRLVLGGDDTDGDGRALALLDPVTGRETPHGPLLEQRGPGGSVGPGQVTALRATAAGLLACGSFTHADGAARPGLVLLDRAGRVLPYHAAGGPCDRIEAGDGKVVLGYEGTAFRVLPAPAG